MQENYPILVAVKPLKSEYERFQKIPITCEDFTLGRGLNNSTVIAYLAISRKHCAFKKLNETDWAIEDYSAFGIQVNNTKLKKGTMCKLSNNDTIQLDATGEFVYKFVNNIEDDDFETPRKKARMYDDSEILNDVKLKFEESQNYEIKHIEEKIHNTKQLQTANLILKNQLEQNMARKIEELESHFALQIDNLNGEKNEVERQKLILEKERDAQLDAIKSENESKIKELMEQIQKHNETEAELLKENSELKKKLLKEREDFLEELNRESSSKQELLQQLEAKIREQEEMRLKEKEETERLRLAKEQELKELEEQKRLRELELEQELNDLKKNLEEQVSKTESERLKAQQEMTEKLEELKKMSDEEKAKMELILQERSEAEKKLTEAELNAAKKLDELREQVKERETQLAALAAERIQQQAEQSGAVISNLQQQLEKMKSELESEKTEKYSLLESICSNVGAGEGSSKEATLAEVGNLMESELQCSICAELFVSATTLNCSHTYCKYCITLWKKKKRECPICRTPITSECKSLVLDSFIDKMVQNLTDELRIKREAMLKDRQELEQNAQQNTVGTSRYGGAGDSYDNDSYDEYGSEGLEEEEDSDHYRHTYPYYDSRIRRRRYYDESDDDDDDDDEDGYDDDEDGYGDDDEDADNSDGGSDAPSHSAATATTAETVSRANSSSASSGDAAASSAETASDAASSTVSQQGVIVVDGASPASRAATTAATGAASAAAPAGTGPRAAPSGSHNPPLNAIVPYSAEAINNMEVVLLRSLVDHNYGGL